MRTGCLRVRDYIVRPDTHGWVLATIKRREKGVHAGEEYEADVRFPGTFPLALKRLLERMVADGLEPDQQLAQAIVHVDLCYREIQRAAGVS